MYGELKVDDESVAQSGTVSANLAERTRVVPCIV